MLSKDTHPSNALSPRVSTLSGNVTFLSERQFAKACSLIWNTLGKSTSSSEEPVNAYLPIVSNDLGNVTEVISQPSKAKSLIEMILNKPCLMDQLQCFQVF